LDLFQRSTQHTHIQSHQASPTRSKKTTIKERGVAYNTPMMTQKPFDINVAVVGNVSAGKSTLLNALLRAKYSEVSMKRTTAGINYFRIHTKGTSMNEESPMDDDDTKGEWVEMIENPHTAESALQEITVDNALLRETNTILEKYFDIELEDNFCTDVHSNARLVLVDIPGLNEAQTGAKYQEYLTSKWRTFDCIIVVMDAKQGVNTDDQVNLLKFVKKNQEIRFQPVIILCNKVDDPEDEEQSEMVQEARKEVERVFEVTDRAKAMSKILQPGPSDAATVKSLLPAFLSFSASHAYFHQTVSLLSFEAFKKFDDKDLIEKYGKEYVGRAKWKGLSADDKIKAVYGIVTDPVMRQEGLEISSFDRLVKVLNKCVGGGATQMSLVVDRMNSSLKSLSLGPVSLTVQLAELYKTYQCLSKCQKDENILSTAVEDMVKRFWENWLSSHQEALVAIKRSPQGVSEMAPVVSELLRYRDFTQSFPSDQKVREEKEIEGKMQMLVDSMFETLFSIGQRLQKDSKQVLTSKPASTERSDTWKLVSPKDWIRIWGSVKLGTADKCFFESFGKDKLLLDDLMYEARLLDNEESKTSPCGRCSECGKSYSCKPLPDHEGTSIRVCSPCRKIPLLLSISKVELGQCARCNKQISDVTGVCSDSTCGCVYRHIPIYSCVCAYSGGRLKGAPGKCPMPSYCSKTMSELTYLTLYVGDPIIVPQSLSEPSHFGHVFWCYSEYLCSVRASSKKRKLP
jgi:small GTP-binding protein